MVKFDQFDELKTSSHDFPIGAKIESLELLMEWQVKSKQIHGKIFQNFYQFNELKNIGLNLLYVQISDRKLMPN